MIGGEGMVKETIEAVKEAEIKAEQMLKEASEQGRVLVEETKNQAQARVEEAKNVIRAKENEAEAVREKDGEAYLDQALQEAKQEVASLKQTAEQKAQEVIASIMESFI